MERQPVGKHDTAPTGATSAEAARPPVTVTSAAAARRHVRSVVGERWRPPSPPPTEAAMIDLLLVVSELVTNAVRHGGGLAGFDVTVTVDGVRLDVRDYSATAPAAAHGGLGMPPRSHEGSGYGWPLINRLSREVDVRTEAAGGKTISVLVPLV